MAQNELLRSHDQLRAALRVAAREISRLSFGKRDSRVQALIRTVLKEARGIAKVESSVVNMGECSTSEAEHRKGARSHV